MMADGRRVLVVEDDFFVALDTMDLLRASGCEIVGPAASLVAAFELVHSERLDAAVLDVGIRGELIWPVAEELLRRHVPIVFLSAYSDTSIFPEDFASVPRLPKPLQGDRLLACLKTLWGAGAEGCERAP